MINLFLIAVAWVVGFCCAAILFSYLAWTLHRRLVMRHMIRRKNDAIGDELEKRRAATESTRKYAVRPNAGTPARESNLFPVQQKLR